MHPIWAHTQALYKNKQKQERKKQMMEQGAKCSQKPHCCEHMYIYCMVSIYFYELNLA